MRIRARDIRKANEDITKAAERLCSPQPVGPAPTLLHSQRLSYVEILGVITIITVLFVLLAIICTKAIQKARAEREEVWYQVVATGDWPDGRYFVVTKWYSRPRGPRDYPPPEAMVFLADRDPPKAGDLLNGNRELVGRVLVEEETGQ